MHYLACFYYLYVAPLKQNNLVRGTKNKRKSKYTECGASLRVCHFNYNKTLDFIFSIILPQDCIKTKPCLDYTFSQIRIREVFSCPSLLNNGQLHDLGQT